MAFTVEQLAKRLGAKLIGDGSAAISSVSPIDTARPDCVTFVTDDHHAQALKDCRAGAVLTAKSFDGLAIPQIVVNNVQAALIETLRTFAPKLNPPAPGIDPSAKVAPTAKIGQRVCVLANAVIEDNASIGDGSVIGCGCIIGQNTTIGPDCRFDANVVIYHNCTIGRNVIIQANSTIGSTGFGYYFLNGAHTLIPHNGTVIIEDFVEIGANCCVDRAKFDATIIGAGTKIDNFVQIAHNVVIGKCCLIAACSGVAGSSRLGDGVVLGGRVGVIDNIDLGDRVMVAANGLVSSDIPEGKVVAGFPAGDLNEWLRQTVLIRRLPKAFEQLKQLNDRIDKLEASEHHKK